MKDTTIDILRKVPAFSKLKEEALKKIANMTIERNVRKGSIIFMDGDPGEAFYFVKSGKIKVYKTTADGRELIFTILSQGDVFAEVTLFNDIPYPASTEVLEDASIGMIRNQDLEELIRGDADIALQIIKVFSKKLFASQQKVKELALGDTYMRTALTILKLGEEHGVESAAGIEIELNISRQELANMIGTARETVSRALSQFKKEGALEVQGKKIIIQDIKKLRSWVQ
ncbi:putative transcriptional regulator, Crp/Fnr family [Alkaliphilus metalliredigens QYMF]|uniref:Putative transcriptional regulator, Crp/Fnr family n=1 Tax=Alkaliphilus metalliredigens (strain QYMF) TaxID=293826 RepID=A6TMH0_ALKMQ|nr:Crp/Fnr family transcriptional regulator [Alkaliphilus metalliredigens]ABR47388.1 putative transcriptional regulator, Crp/Fnr family [Alkaliphilus metalliredigens QYMF]